MISFKNALKYLIVVFTIYLIANILYHKCPDAKYNNFIIAMTTAILYGFIDAFYPSVYIQKNINYDMRLTLKDKNI